jgi:hypothetical protein
MNDNQPIHPLRNPNTFVAIDFESAQAFEVTRQTATGRAFLERRTIATDDMAEAIKSAQDSAKQDQIANALMNSRRRISIPSD